MARTSGKEEEFLHRLTEITKENLTDRQFGVSELAAKMGMSRSNLHRKVNSTLGLSVSKFICRIRLDRAHELLSESDASISEIAFESGFHSVTYFSKCFKEHFGHPPGESRDRVRAQMEMEAPPLQARRWRILGKWLFPSFLVAA